MTSVDWTAQWIWTAGEASPVNFYLAARRDFDVAADATGAERRLHIAADTRYRLYLNGEWIGDGPARSFHFNQQFDTYDVTGLLRAGHNTLAVLVNHFGEGTFQYQPSGQAGLLVQLERRSGAGWAAEVITDGQWLARRHEGFRRPTPRIACQQPFVEIFDARAFAPDWYRPEGSAEGFAPAQVLGPVGSGPWRSLVARTIPFLTRTPVLPVRTLHVGLVQPPNWHFGFNARTALIGRDRQQNHQILKGFAAALIDSPIAQPLTVNLLSPRHEMPWVNGQELVNGEPAQLKAGLNLIVIPFSPRVNHIYDRSYPAFVETPVTLRGVFGEHDGLGGPEAPWTVFGPFENWAELRPQVCAVASAEALAPYREQAHALTADETYYDVSPAGTGIFARSLPGTAPISELNALISDDARVAVIEPSLAGMPSFFVDFGREQVGYTVLDVEGPAGAILDLVFLEEIEEDVRIHYPEDNECSVRYILREGRQRYTTFLRRGYRYARVIVREQTRPVRLRAVQTLFSAYPSVRRGSFDCSDSLLTRIWDVGRHTLQCCSEDTFTDCPLYEQTFWVGDARNEAMTNYAAFGDESLTKRCAELVAESLFRQPIPESQVPSAWENLLPAWSYLWVLEAEEHYGYSGDRAYLERIYPAVRTTMRNTREKLTDERGLFSIDAWNMFDWAGIDDQHKVVTHNEMFVVGAYRAAERLANELGRTEDAAWFAQEREALIAAINQHLWDETRGAYVDAMNEDGTLSPKVCQQTNSLAILYGVASGERLARLGEVAANPPEGMTRVGSPFALFYILEALARQGRQSDILRIVRERWGEMIKLGATTFWEVFPGFDPHWWTRSYCHAWSSAPVYFLTRYQLGAWWAAPGYARARIAPQPLDLTWAKGRVPTPVGEIEVSWESKDGVFTLDVALPAPTAAEVELPVSAAEYATIEGGSLTAEGHAFTAQKVDGRWRLELPAGARARIIARRA